jgi:hypothetical protein
LPSTPGHHGLDDVGGDVGPGPLGPHAFAEGVGESLYAFVQDVIEGALRRSIDAQVRPARTSLWSFEFIGASR